MKSSRHHESKPSDVLRDASDVLRQYVKIGRYRTGPSIGKPLYYTREIREAIKWLEYAAGRADEVLAEPSRDTRSRTRRQR